MNFTSYYTFKDLFFIYHKYIDHEFYLEIMNTVFIKFGKFTFKYGIFTFNYGMFTIEYGIFTFKYGMFLPVNMDCENQKCMSNDLKARFWVQYLFG